MTLRPWRLADVGSVPAGLRRDRHLDRTALAGYWRNTNPATQGLESLRIWFDGDKLLVESRDRDGGRVAWRDDAQHAVYSESPFRPEPVAFTCRAHLGACDGILQGNLNMGLLVLGLYRTPDGEHPFGVFSREFFARQPPPNAEPTDPPAGDGALFSGFAHPSSLDLKPLLGNWRNTDPAPRGHCDLCLESTADGLVLAATGIGPSGATDWGTTTASAYACLDETGRPSTSLLATFDFGFLHTDLQIRAPGGTLVVASFNRFDDDSGRLDYFGREFFYRRQSTYSSSAARSGT